MFITYLVYERFFFKNQLYSLFVGGWKALFEDLLRALTRPLMRMMRKLFKEELQESKELDNQYNVNELIVGKKYVDGPWRPVADTSENAVSNTQVNATFAPQETSEAVTESDGSKSDESGTGSENASGEPEMMWEKLNNSHEMILVAGDFGQDVDEEIEVRPIPAIRPESSDRSVAEVMEQMIEGDPQQPLASQEEQDALDSFDLSKMR